MTRFCSFYATSTGAVYRDLSRDRVTGGFVENQAPTTLTIRRFGFGPEITCFEWRAHASDFLDGLLPEKTKRDADDHLVGCPACREQLKHFRAILAALSAQPRSALPIGIRKAPLGFRIPKPDANLKISRWERAPWYVRTAIEGFGVGLLILAIITVIPKARELYEKSTQRKIEAIGFDDPELGMKGEGAETLQLARGRSDPGNGGGVRRDGLENSEGDDSGVR